MTKFYIADCPEDTTIFNWISQSLDFDTAKADVKNRVFFRLQQQGQRSR